MDSCAAPGRRPSFGPPVSIAFVRWEGAARLYAVLARLNLGADAASIFDAGLPGGSWVQPLLDAYRAAPGRLVLHAVPLLGAGGVRTVLEDEPPRGLQDPPGRRLCAAALEALDATAAEAVSYAATPVEIVEPLQTLRTALWERVGPPPSLTIADCPALGRAGRAAAAAQGRVVAVSLAESPEHVLCQALHEETHAVTDPLVRQSWTSAGARRDTAVGSQGYARHQALETAAVEVGDALIAARAPAWSGAYRRWRARFGV